MCYALVFVAMSQWMDNPEIYMMDYHNSREACEARLVKKARTLNGTLKINETDHGLSVVLKTSKDWSYGKCTLAPIYSRAICDQGISGNTDNCDCEQLNNE